MKLGEGLLLNPEDVTVNTMGVLYATTRHDSWLDERKHKNEPWENWQWINSKILLGITTAAAGGVIVCDSDKVQSSISKWKTSMVGLSAMMTALHSFAAVKTR